MSNTRDEMNPFVIGMSDNLVEEYREAILYENMDMNRLIVHAQQVEESRV